MVRKIFVPKEEEVTGELGKIRNGESLKLYDSSNIICTTQ